LVLPPRSCAVAATSRTLAAAASAGPDIDYLHLAKVNGEWRIVNVLWAPTAAPE